MFKKSCQRVEQPLVKGLPESGERFFEPDPLALGYFD